MVGWFNGRMATKTKKNQQKHYLKCENVNLNPKSKSFPIPVFWWRKGVWITSAKMSEKEKINDSNNEKNREKLRKNVILDYIAFAGRISQTFSITHFEMVDT